MPRDFRRAESFPPADHGRAFLTPVGFSLPCPGLFTFSRRVSLGVCLIFNALIPAAYGQADGNTVIGSQTLDTYSVYYCDPLDLSSNCRSSAGVNASGDAFDRQNIQIGLNLNNSLPVPLASPANTSLATVQPPEAYNAIGFSFLDPTIATVSPLALTQSLPTTLQITPINKGATTLVATGYQSLPPGATSYSLGVFSFPALFPGGATVPIAFYMLADATTLGYTVTQLNSIISQLPATQSGPQSVNAIWSQYNIPFSMAGAITLSTVAYATNPIVLGPTEPVVPQSTTTPFNVYFVPSIKDLNDPATPHPLGFTYMPAAYVCVGGPMSLRSAG